MKLISKKDTKKLVKGAIYDAIKIETKKTNTNYFRPIVVIRINNNQVSFTPNSFTLTNGEDIPEMNWISPTYEDYFIQSNYQR